jgi:hypothetical protein
MHQHDVRTRLVHVQTPHVWYESHLLHPVCTAKVVLWCQQCWHNPTGLIKIYTDLPILTGYST